MCIYRVASSFSKCFLAAAILSSVAADSTIKCMSTKVKPLWIRFQVCKLTYARIRHDNHRIGVVGQNIDEGCKWAPTNLHTFESCLWSTTPYVSNSVTSPRYKQSYYLHPRLNCLMILLIFSKRCKSWCSMVAALAITRNVVLSNSTTSSASHVRQKWSRCDSRMRILGIKQCTICDQA